MAQLNRGDLVRIAFAGRVAADNSLFETTDEPLARAAGLWSPEASYGPRLVIYGVGAMISGLEEGIAALAPGQSAEVKIPSSKAFGPRYRELVRVMPEKEFARHGVRPVSNLMVTIDGVPALVKSVSSGRILLDFNHPLAGQDLIYSLQLIEVVSDPALKAQALAKAFGGSAEVSSSGGKLVVKAAAGLPADKAKGLMAALRSSLGEAADLSVPGA